MGALYSYQSEIDIEADERSKHHKHLVCRQIKNSNIKLKPIIPITNKYEKMKESSIIRL
jgi:hypothetical protein